MVFQVKTPEDFDLEDDTQYKRVFLEHLNARVRNNKMNLVICLGATGTGKSLASCSLAEELHQKIFPGIEYDCDNHVAFTTLEFLEKVKSLPDKSVIVFDETSIALSSKRSMSNVNLLLSHLFTSFRARRFTVFLCFPNFLTLEKSVRELTNFTLQTKGIDKKRRLNKLAVKYIQINPKTGKDYSHSYEVSIPNEGRFILPNIYTGLPSKAFMTAYEKKKSKFISDITENVWGQIPHDEEQGKVRNKLTQRQEQIVELREQGLKLQDIARELGISSASVHGSLQGAQKKGVILKK